MRQDRQSARERGRKAVLALNDAEMDLLIASQRAARRAAAQAIDAALSARHSSAIAAVVSRFADRRIGLTGMSETQRAAALRQLATDEAHELARLALEHASEKRAKRKSALQSMSIADKAARRSLRLRNHRQRIVVAVQQQRIDRGEPRSTSQMRRAVSRSLVSRTTPPSN